MSELDRLRNSSLGNMGNRNENRSIEQRLTDKTVIEPPKEPIVTKAGTLYTGVTDWVVWNNIEWENQKQRAMLTYPMKTKNDYIVLYKKMIRDVWGPHEFGRFILPVVSHIGHGAYDFPPDPYDKQNSDDFLQRFYRGTLLDAMAISEWYQRNDDSRLDVAMPPIGYFRRIEIKATFTMTVDAAFELTGRQIKLAAQKVVTDSTYLLVAAGVGVIAIGGGLAYAQKHV